MVSGMRRTIHSALRGLLAVFACAAVIVPGVLMLNRGYHRYLSGIYPLEHRELVETAAQEYAVPVSLIYAIIHTESGFLEDAISSAGAKGLMQITDDTFQWALNRAGEKGKYTSEALYDPAVNIHYGVYVLSLLREQFIDTETALAAYNAGQGRVREWLRDPACSDDGMHLDNIPYAETAEYIRRVTQTQKRYQALYDLE